MRAAKFFASHRMTAGIGGILFLTFLAACGAGGIREDAIDVAEIFYSGQIPGNDAWPEDLFADEGVARKAENVIARREREFGRLVSYKRIASNKRVSVEAQGRIATATYIFEVTCESGKTREMLTITKSGGSEPFLITEYIIEDVQRKQESVPSGTSSA